MRKVMLLIMLVTGVGYGFASEKTFPPVTLPDTQVRVIHAVTNDVDYKLYVSLPKDYFLNDERYPVVYMLDADYSFAICRNIVEHLSDRDHLTKAILVGIAYDGPDAYRLNRTRDYTPVHVATGGYGPEYQKVSGGGPLFLRFIASELIPFMETEYRCSDKRVLVGHSYGGLFTSWVSLVTFDLFDGFIAVSPSLWYDDGLVFRLENELAPTREDWPIRMYAIVGSREVNNHYNMVGDLQKYMEILGSRKYPGLNLSWEVAEDETHNSVFPRGLSNGLRFVLEGR